MSVGCAERKWAGLPREAMIVGGTVVMTKVRFGRNAASLMGVAAIAIACVGITCLFLVLAIWA